MAWGLPPPGGGGKRGRDTKVSLPLLTPQPFLKTRLPPVARLKTRGPQGRLVLQGHTLDGSGAFRSANLTPCTVWPRTVMRGKSRKVNSGPYSVPKANRRTEPSPRNPRLVANASLSGLKEGLGESRGGKGTIRCPCPLLPLAVGTAYPAGEHRHLRRRAAAMPTPCHGEYPPSREGLSRLRRQAAGTAERHTVSRRYKRKAALTAQPFSPMI